MAGRIDTEAIRRSVNIADVVGQYVTLQPNGKEHRALCPFHDEKSPSFTVTDDYYHCFGCGAHGDVIDFVTEFTGATFLEACKALGSDNLPEGQPLERRASQRHNPYEGYEPAQTNKTIKPGEPIDLINPKRNGKVWQGATPVAVYPYGDAYVLRLEIDGKKLTPQVRWCRSSTGEGWTFYPMDPPRPLYRLYELQMNPDAQVLIVEGEKAADAAANVLAENPSVVVVSWCGGTNGLKHADLSPLKGRNAVIIPDNDAPGQKAAVELISRVEFQSVDTVSPPAEYPEGWDVADRDWESGAEFLAWCRKHKRARKTPDPVDEFPEPLPCDLENGDYDEPEPIQPISDATSHLWTTWIERRDPHDPSSSPKPMVHNAQVFLTYHPDCRNVFAYNEFTKGAEIMRQPPWEPRPATYPRQLSDVDETRATAWLERNGVKLSIGIVHNAIVSAAHHRPYNPLQDYLSALMWDGKPRIDNALRRYFGAADNGYTQAISRRFLIGSVARAMRPGCQMDNILILEGAQGIKKSTAVAALFSDDWYTDELSDLGSKDSAMQVQGVWCVELAELSTLSRAEANRIKEWITRRHDRFRPPYGRNLIRAPRQCVLVGTVNPEGGYLRDATGGRRFWPVRCSTIDIEGIQADRNQIWAEAMEAFNDGDRWWLEPLEQHAAQAEQEDRYEGDVWLEPIAEYLLARQEASIHEIMEYLQLPASQQTLAYQTRIARVLVSQGWERVRRRKNGARLYIYVRGGASNDEND